MTILRRPPCFDRRSRLEKRALTHPPEHVRIAELFDADVERERCERVELMRIQRGFNHLFEGRRNLHQVVKQQGLGILFGDLSAFASVAGMTIADHPDAIGAPSRAFA